MIKITAPITDLLKIPKPSTKITEGTASKKPPTPKFEWTAEANKAFQKIKKAFTDAPILQHFDPAKPITVQTDASGFAIAGILNQPD